MTLKWKGDQVKRTLEQAGKAGLFKCGNRVRNESIDLQQGTPRTGRTYTRGSVKHTASSPGNPPAVDRGDNIRNIRLELKGLTCLVIAAGPNARELEFGTAKMAARPFMRPALANTKRDFEQIIGNEIAKALQTK